MQLQEEHNRTTATKQQSRAKQRYSRALSSNPFQGYLCNVRKAEQHPYELWQFASALCVFGIGVGCFFSGEEEAKQKDFTLWGQSDRPKGLSLFNCGLYPIPDFSCILHRNDGWRIEFK
ncbi:hypothetical protein HPP92_001297 [Vanilla planifolia]|uniref:Uncharacterized protein n=1 Tax=Vanilla planifolia TaxID=51239 RepID=A0A835RXX3_VANPL|nr:hypothetical protein HPP92_001297 [Vanilla planifolia]